MDHFIQTLKHRVHENFAYLYNNQYFSDCDTIYCHKIKPGQNVCNLKLYIKWSLSKNIQVPLKRTGLTLNLVY